MTTTGRDSHIRPFDQKEQGLDDLVRLDAEYGRGCGNRGRMADVTGWSSASIACSATNCCRSAGERAGIAGVVLSSVVVALLVLERSQEFQRRPPFFGRVGVDEGMEQWVGVAQLISGT